MHPLSILCLPKGFRFESCPASHLFVYNLASARVNWAHPEKAKEPAISSPICRVYSLVVIDVTR